MVGGFGRGLPGSSLSKHAPLWLSRGTSASELCVMGHHTMKGEGGQWAILWAGYSLPTQSEVRQHVGIFCVIFFTLAKIKNYGKLWLGLNNANYVERSSCLKKKTILLVICCQVLIIPAHPVLPVLNDPGNGSLRNHIRRTEEQRTKGTLGMTLSHPSVIHAVGWSRMARHSSPASGSVLLWLQSAHHGHGSTPRSRGGRKRWVTDFVGAVSLWRWQRCISIWCHCKINI